MHAVRIEIYPHCISLWHHSKLIYGRNPLLAYDNRYPTQCTRNPDRATQPRRHYTAAENARTLYSTFTPSITQHPLYPLEVPCAQLICPTKPALKGQTKDEMFSG